jgi:thiol:disulfide interchange protein DsbC
MNRTRHLIAGLLAIAASDPTTAKTKPTQDFTAIEQAVRRALPSTRIDAIAPAPIPGLVEVVAGDNLLYTDPTGRWLVVGHLYDLKTARDLTAERKAQLVRLDWQALPLAAAVHSGEGPARLAVFADPGCGWCRRLHQELRETQGIEVWEILFPVPALHPASRDQAIAVLCHDDPAEALSRVMTGAVETTEPSPADCLEHAQAHIDQAVAFGRAHGIQGTPTLVAPDGRVHHGYLPIEQLRDWLAQGTFRAVTE